MRAVSAVLSVFATLLLGGCPSGIFLPDNPMSDALTGLEPGVHGRADVAALLGDPLVSLPDRGVEVFVREGELTDVLLPGIPYTTDWTYYTLVSYDEKGTLTGIDTGGNVYRTTLRAGRFSYGMGRTGTLLEQELTPAYDVPGEACTVVLTVVGGRWSDKLYYRDPIRLSGTALPGPPDFASYSYHSLAPGRQELSVTWTGRQGTWSREQAFDCGAGDLLYVVLAGDRKEAPITVGPAIPPELPGRALLLYPPPTDAPLPGR